MSLARTRHFEATWRSGLMQLPLRSAVFELAAGRVFYSPASTLSAGQLREAGPVTDIVAPSLAHTAGMKAAAAANPGARLWGPPGARDKHPGLPWHGVLGVDPWPFEDELELIPLPGIPALQEFALLHRASRALYLSDLVYNVTDPQGLVTRLAFRMFGMYRRFAVSKLFVHLIKDRAALTAALADLAGRDFLHVVPAHGEPMLHDGKPVLIAALRERGLLA